MSANHLMLQPISVEDRQAILDIISKYSHSYDSKDLEAFLGLFTANCVWTVYTDRGAELTCQYTGRDELAVAMRQRLSDLTEKGIQSRHYQTNTLLTPISESEVKAVTMLNLMWQYSDTNIPALINTGIYHDVIVKIHGVWKFAKRTALIDQKENK